MNVEEKLCFGTFAYYPMAMHISVRIKLFWYSLRRIKGFFMSQEGVLNSIGIAH